MEAITYRPGDILRETAGEIRAILGSDIRDLTLERVVLGLFFTGIKLSNGTGGLCFTPIKSIPEAVCCPSSARVMPASGRLKGKKAGELVDEMFSGNPLKRAMGIAVLNALSATLWKERPPVDYLIETGVDAADRMDIPDGCYAIVVGAIIPVLKALKARGEPFGILEEDPLTLKPDEMKYYIAPPLAFEKIPQADVLIITGTTLINDTLEKILEARKPDARVIVMGPTASMIPGAFVRRGVDLLGGVLVTDADRVLDVISEAGSGYHFFGRGAEKITAGPLKL
jgi:uncharacterized protein (DUF4213/DUF364 family)